MRVLRLEFTACLNMVFAIGEALDDANDIVTFGVGEGDVGISFGRQLRLVRGREGETDSENGIMVR